VASEIIHRQGGSFIHEKVTQPYGWHLPCFLEHNKKTVQPYLPESEQQAKVSEKVKDGPNASVCQEVKNGQRFIRQ
jgi:hypothetical protein